MVRVIWFFTISVYYLSFSKFIKLFHAGSCHFSYNRACCPSCVSDCHRDRIHNFYSILLVSITVVPSYLPCMLVPWLAICVGLLLPVCDSAEVHVVVNFDRPLTLLVCTKIRKILKNQRFKLYQIGHIY